MSTPYRIFGSEMSPYSVKVRSWFRYKGAAHEWCEGRIEEARPYQKLPLIPVVVTPEGEGLQDSTPIIEKLEAQFPEPSIHPEDSVLAFLSALLEEFGDEWGNKWMFHYRWARPVDQESAALRLVRSNMPGLEASAEAAMAKTIRERMTPRVWFVGSNKETAPQIEASFKAAARLLEAQLEGRPYLFGARPAFADFGLWGQLYNARSDPTAGALLEESCPKLVAWIERMLEPTDDGPFEARAALLPTLLPLLKAQVGALFCPWTLANEKALADSAEEFTVELASGAWTQKPQKYHARSIKALRARYEATADKTDLDPILEQTGCLKVLRG